jgi:hypothetical protein
MKPDYLQKRSWGFVAIARSDEAILCLEKYVEDLDKGELHWRTVPSEKCTKRFAFYAPVPEISESDFLTEFKKTRELLLWAKTGEYLVWPFASKPVEMSPEELRAVLTEKRLRERKVKISERHAAGWGEVAWVILHDHESFYADESKALWQYASELVENGALIWEYWDKDRGLKLALPRGSEALRMVRERTKRENKLLEDRMPKHGHGELYGLLIGTFDDREELHRYTISIP